MTSYFSALIDFVHAHSQYTHIAIFLLALSEAIPRRCSCCSMGEPRSGGRCCWVDRTIRK